MEKGLFKRIDHIGIIVRDAVEAEKLYCEALGFKRSEEQPPADSDGNFTSVLLESGDVRVELIAPAGPNSPFASILDNRGEGVHHISIEVGDIDKQIELMKSMGVRFVSEKAQEVGGNRVTFMHPKSTKGVLVELTQKC